MLKPVLAPREESKDQIRWQSRRNHHRSLAFTSPPGFVEPLDLHTCYTPWPVFRDVTDGAGLYTTLFERPTEPA